MNTQSNSHETVLRLRADSRWEATVRIVDDQGLNRPLVGYGVTPGSAERLLQHKLAGRALRAHGQ